MQGNIGVVGNASIDVELEAAHRGGGIGGQGVESLGVRAESDVGVRSAQRDCGGAGGSLVAHILEGNAQVGVVADMGRSRCVAVNSNEGSIIGYDLNCTQIGYFIITKHTEGQIGANGQSAIDGTGCYGWHR